MTAERQRQVLFALLLILGGVVGWRILAPAVGGSDGLPAAVQGSGSDAGSLGARVEVLRVADLDLEPGEFRVGRDPFRFEVARRTPPPAPQPKPAPAARPQQPRPRPAPARQQASPQPPPVDLVYLGRFGPAGRPIAVFSDGSDIFNVFEGGVVKEHFVVDKIGYESADLKFVNFPDEPAKRLAIGG